MDQKARIPRRSRGRTRDPYSRVLIVCGGEKTEPNYFEGLKDDLKLDNVEIAGEGYTPEKIVEYAKRLCKDAKRKGNSFNTVFCVFDKDEHTHYKNAIERCKQEITFEAIYSVPCFEYWLLLHYEYTTRPYQKVGNKSAGDKALSHLKQHLPDYDKSDRDIFRHFKDKLEDATKHAARSLEYARSAGTDNPSTTVHILVHSLQNIKNPDAPSPDS